MSCHLESVSTQNRVYIFQNRHERFIRGKNQRECESSQIKGGLLSTVEALQTHCIQKLNVQPQYKYIQQLFTYQVPLLGEFWICGFNMNVSLVSSLGNLLLCPNHLKITHTQIIEAISQMTHLHPCKSLSSLFSPLTRDVRAFCTACPHSKNTHISHTMFFSICCVLWHFIRYEYVCMKERKKKK